MLPIERKLPRIVIDADLRFLRVNSAYVDLVGYPAAELVGRPIADLIPSPELTRGAERIAALMREAFIPSLVWYSSVRRRDGTDLEVVGLARQIYSENGVWVKSLHGVVPWEQRLLLLPELASAARDARDHLSAREQEVVELLEGGLHPKDIARELRLSVHTVRNHLRFVYRKLGVRSQLELMARLRSGS
jgi:PAS domain S-box-containing protein